MAGRIVEVTTLAGAGTPGFVDAAGAAASFHFPFGLAVRPADGAYLLADAMNQRVRVLAPEPPHECSTLAGGGDVGEFNNPLGVAVDAGSSVLVADSANMKIKRIALNGEVSTLAGAGVPGTQDIGDPPFPDNRAPSQQPSRQRRGSVSTLAGTGSADYIDGPVAQAAFSTPVAVAVDSAGNIFVADFSNHAVRKISSGTEGGGRIVSTLAGNGLPGNATGVGSQSCFCFPIGLAIDGDYNVLVSDRDNHRICSVSPAGVVSVLAGRGTLGYMDGPAAQAAFNTPRGLCIDAAGNVAVADYSNHRVRLIKAGLRPPPALLAATAAARRKATSAPLPLSSFREDMLGLLDGGELADVVFCVEGLRVPAHACILQARSAYFRSLLCSGFKEGEQCGKADITIRDTTPSAFRALLRYLYTDHLQVDDEEMIDVMLLAQCYQVQALYDFCVARCKGHLTVDNAVQWFVGAHMRELPDIRAVALGFIKANFRRIKAEAPETMQLLIDHPELMMELLMDAL
eukprot:jgi/Tetstr1/448323/TSEL_035607.t1